MMSIQMAEFADYVHGTREYPEECGPATPDPLIPISLLSLIESHVKM